MKKALPLLFALIGLAVYGQESTTTSAPTTEEEYNYLTKGYKIQAESGLDMKKGYLIRDMGAWKEGNYSFEFKALIREVADELAGIMVIVKADSWSGISTYYLCIPINNPDLMKLYHDRLSSLSFIALPYAKILSVYYAQTLYSGAEMAKKLPD